MAEVVQLLEDAMRFVREGQPQQARQLIRRVLAKDPRSEDGWLLMAYVAQSVEERRAALWQLLTLNPDHERIRQAYLNLTDASHIQRAAQNGVFLSYAQADQLFAVQLAEDLRFVGIPVWLDTVDIPNDSDWHESVANALERCGLMLAVASQAALKAESTLAETSHFMRIGKIALPVQVEAGRLDELGMWTKPVDFSVDYDLGLQNLVQLLAIPEVARQL